MYYYLVPSEEEANCVRYNEFVRLTIDGVVVNKCFDHHEHSYPAIDIKNDHSVQRFYLLDDSHLFERLNLSDTILKKENSDVVLIKRNGVFTKLIKPDFGCKKH